MSRANTSVIQRRKGAISTEPGNRIAGAFTPAAVSYCLHCKNAANCDHMMLSLNSHGDLCIIQTIIKIVMHKMLTMIVFCGIALDSFYREALTFHLSRVGRVRPRVKQMFDSGPFHIRPSGNPSSRQPKGTRA